MILSGPEIRDCVERGEIVITPFKPENIGPNSLDLTLGSELQIYVDKNGVPIDSLLGDLDAVSTNEEELKSRLERRGAILDFKHSPLTRSITIPEDEGYVLMPGRGYLAQTVERVETDMYVPHLHGRSSVGRMFVSVHHTAGWGDVGFHGTWTLEMTVVHPVRIYPNVRICQIAFEECKGELMLYGSMRRSKYQNQGDPQKSRIHEDFG